MRNDTTMEQTTEQESSVEKKKKKQNPFEPQGFLGMIYVMLHDIVCILAATTLCFVFFARLVEVSGCSMYPTLVGAQEKVKTMGDYLVLRSNFLSADYQPGDIVVACVPQFEDGKPIVKRVIARGGQNVSFRSGADGMIHVWVDGELQSEDHIYEGMQPNGIGTDGSSFTVPEGCYFLMGDNRNNSRDSRFSEIGMVDGRYIVGKAWGIVFPGQDLLKNNDRDFNRFGSVYD